MNFYLFQRVNIVVETNAKNAFARRRRVGHIKSVVYSMLLYYEKPMYEDTMRRTASASRWFQKKKTKKTLTFSSL